MVDAVISITSLQKSYYHVTRFYNQFALKVTVTTLADNVLPESTFSATWVLLQ